MANEPPKKPHGIGWYAAWGVLALVVYVATSGPVTFAVNFFDLEDGSPVYAIYKPLQIANDSNVYVNAAYEDYLVPYFEWCAERGKSFGSR